MPLLLPLLAVLAVLVWPGHALAAAPPLPDGTMANEGQVILLDGQPVTDLSPALPTGQHDLTVITYFVASATIKWYATIDGADCAPSTHGLDLAWLDDVDPSGLQGRPDPAIVEWVAANDPDGWLRQDCTWPITVAAGEQTIAWATLHGGDQQGVPTLWFRTAHALTVTGVEPSADTGDGASDTDSPPADESAGDGSSSPGGASDSGLDTDQEPTGDDRDATHGDPVLPLCGGWPVAADGERCAPLAWRVSRHLHPAQSGRGRAVKVIVYCIPRTPRGCTGGVRVKALVSPGGLHLTPNTLGQHYSYSPLLERARARWITLRLLRIAQMQPGESRAYSVRLPRAARRAAARDTHGVRSLWVSGSPLTSPLTVVTLTRVTWHGEGR